MNKILNKNYKKIKNNSLLKNINQKIILKKLKKKLFI